MFDIMFIMCKLSPNFTDNESKFRRLIQYKKKEVRKLMIYNLFICLQFVNVYCICIIINNLHIINKVSNMIKFRNINSGIRAESFRPMQ